jgi:hypothetical protein
MTKRWQVALGGIVLAWCLAAAIGSVRAVQARPRDPMTLQEAEFRALAPYLPRRGEVGYLEPDADDQPGDAVRAHYAAQYALAPLVIVARTGADLVIVPRGTVRPEADERLTAYLPVLTLPSGHALYRRTP